MKKLVLASGNKGKLKELQVLFEPLGFDCVSQSAFHVPDIEEPFGTFAENALLKARHASKHTGLPALADDSGLCIPALQGAPGVISARYATLFGQPKGDQNNIECVLKQLQDTPQAQRDAFFVCVLVYLEHADDPCPLIATGRWHGTITDTPKGDKGFGYDPIFFVPSKGCTAAELAPEEKHAMSHRAKAMDQLLKLL